MTVDWFIWLTPLVLLPIVALFVFAGCTFDSGGLVGQYPGLKVITENLNSTAYFRARWTFYRQDTGQPVDDIVRPSTWPGQTVPAAVPGMQYQPVASIEVDINDPELAGILQQNPDVVRCECFVKDETKKQEDHADAGPSAYTAGSGPTMIWILTRDIGQNYYLTRDQYK